MKQIDHNELGYIKNREEWKCGRVMSKQANVIATTIIVRGDVSGS